MCPFNVLVATDLTEEGIALLRDAHDMHLHNAAPTIIGVREKLKAVHAIISRDDLPIDASMLQAAPELRVIARVGADLSGIDLDCATARGVIVMNTPGANATAAGEHAITLMLALSRRLITAHNSLKEGWWLLDRKQQAGTQLKGKTLGIVGLGRVGHVVASRCLAFGMTVLAYDPYIGDEQVGDERIQLVGLRELLARSDFVSLHVPATAETRGMFDERLIRQMKPGARLINTAHGAIVDEAAVAAALKDGHLAGAAFDVYNEEPPYNSPLIGMENVIHTPHIGDNTIEAAQDLSIKIVHQVIDALRGVDYRNVVNMPFLPGVDYESARPYMLLAERMGTVLHTLARTPIRRIAVEYRGEDMLGLIKPLTVALLKGVLSPVLADYVNFINAPVIATERGIQVTQAKGLKSSDYASSFLAQATLEDGEQITITGTLLNRREPYIVQINDYRVTFVPQGHLLLMGSYDQPGVIGKVGTLLAQNNINIASWQTGRAQPGGQTLTVLSLDEPVPEAVLAELRAQDFVRHAHQVAM
jgi:D-3-phosphoglycerate dehydrogenase